jgi:hypothetical protein
MAQKEEVPPPMNSTALSHRYLMRVADLSDSESKVNQVLSFASHINPYRLDVSQESTRFEKICLAYLGDDVIHFLVSWFTLSTGEVVLELHKYYGDAIPSYMVLTSLAAQMGMPVQPPLPSPKFDDPAIAWIPSRDEIVGYIKEIDDAWNISLALKNMCWLTSGTHPSNIPLCLLCDKVTAKLESHMSDPSSLDTDALRMAARFFFGVYSNPDCVHIMAPLRPYPGLKVVDLLMHMLSVTESITSFQVWEVEYQIMKTVIATIASYKSLISEFLATGLQDRVKAMCSSPCPRVVKIAQRVSEMIIDFHNETGMWAEDEACI